MTNVGFIGLGIMGMPMCGNLLAAGYRVTVWNRSGEKCAALQSKGARVASSLDDLFLTNEIVMLMLANSRAIDDVLQRDLPGFARVKGRFLVNLGTVAPCYSEDLAKAVAAAGGEFVEAPVSGSRAPAEAGQLIGMVAGRAECIATILPLLQPLCRAVFGCGNVPNATFMKLAVNIFLITQVCGLAESFNFARAANLEPARLAEILNAGQMASAISRIKLDKLLENDLTPQAAIADVHMNCRLIYEAARDLRCKTPLLDESESLYRRAVEDGLGTEDMIGVIKAL
ncbi:MAG TPA: NAD(P)-dependent oxidoreductase [Candidatus Aquilonibacter sp.]